MLQQIFGGEILHGNMADLIDHDTLLPDDEQDAMGDPFPWTIQHLSQLNGQEFAFAGDSMLFRIVGKRIQSSDQAIEPTGGDVGIFFCIPVSRCIHLLLSGGSENAFSLH